MNLRLISFFRASAVDGITEVKAGRHGGLTNPLWLFVLFQANLLRVSNSEEINLFKQSLQDQLPVYGVELADDAQAQLADYYELLLRWNERLHLVAPCPPSEFAGRHVLESLTLIHHLRDDATIADIGSGAGLPIVPCLIVKQHLTATLIESSQKKSVFLREALKSLGLLSKASIVAKPFEQCDTPSVQFVTSRALDRFMTKLPALLSWSPPRSVLLLFGGENLGRVLESMHCNFKSFLLPNSDSRFLFEVEKG